MVTAEMGTTRIGRYTNRVADKMLTPLALRMSQSRALGNLALKTSYEQALLLILSDSNPGLWEVRFQTQLRFAALPIMLHS